MRGGQAKQNLIVPGAVWHLGTSTWRTPRHIACQEEVYFPLKIQWVSGCRENYKALLIKERLLLLPVTCPSFTPQLPESLVLLQSHPHEGFAQAQWYYRFCLYLKNSVQEDLLLHPQRSGFFQMIYYCHVLENQNSGLELHFIIIAFLILKPFPLK